MKKVLEHPGFSPAEDNPPQFLEVKNKTKRMIGFRVSRGALLLELVHSFSYKYGEEM